MPTSRRTRGFTLWFTGLPASGKTTISNATLKELILHGIDEPELLDGDVIRRHISSGLGFSRQDRNANILRIGWVAQLLTKHGVPNLVAAISPYRDTRKQVREMVEAVGGHGSFVEIYVACSVEECIHRDPKGLYAKAIRGEIKGFTGIDDPYEPPENPELALNTLQLDVATSVHLILDYLKAHTLIERP